MDVKNDKTRTGSKKKVEVPKTEVSLAQAQTAKHFYLITSLILVAILIGGGYGSYRLFNNYIYKSNQIKAQDKLIHSLDQKQKDLEALKAPYADITNSKGGIGSDADAILRALPITEDYKSLIAMLENMANVSGVSLDAVSKTIGGAAAAATPAPTPTPTSGTTASGTSTAAPGTSTGGPQQPQPLVFSVSISGPYDKIVRFLDNTEKSARVINFKSMQIASNGQGSGNDIKASLTMETYFQAPADISSTQEDLK
jgi:Tfp pilus assembly protein PilO